MSVAVPGLILALVATGQDFLGARRARVEGAVESTNLLKGSYFLLWVIAVPGTTVPIGQLEALVLFVVMYLLVWAKKPLAVVIPNSTGALIFLYVLFEQIIPVQWYESIFLR